MVDGAPLPPPQLLYPKSGGIFLMSEVQRLTSNVADLIDVLTQRDMQIAQLQSELSALRQPAPAPAPVEPPSPPAESNVVPLAGE